MNALPVQDPVACMADNIYYEAGSEPWAGKLAVGQVTLNRAGGDSSRVCAVVYQKDINPSNGKKVAAFSWTLGARWRARTPPTAASFTYAECTWIAVSMLSGSLSMPSLGASVLWYHADYVHPRWHRTFVVQIGRHRFYR